MKYSTATILTTVLLTSIDIATASTSRPRPQKVDRSRPIRVTPEVAKWSEDFAERQEALKASSRTSASTTAGPLPPRGPGPLPSSTGGSGLSPRPSGGPSPLPRPSGGPGPLPSSTGGPSLPLPRPTPTPTPSAPPMTTVRPAPAKQPQPAFQDTLKAALLARQKKQEVPKPTSPSTSVLDTGAQQAQPPASTPLPASIPLAQSEPTAEDVAALLRRVQEHAEQLQTPTSTYDAPIAPLDLFYTSFVPLDLQVGPPQASSSGAPLIFDTPQAPLTTPQASKPSKPAAQPGNWLADIAGGGAKLKKTTKPKLEEAGGLLIGGRRVGTNLPGAGLGAAGKEEEEVDSGEGFSTGEWEAQQLGGAPKPTLSGTASTAKPAQVPGQKSKLTGTVSGPATAEVTGADLQKHRLLSPPPTEDVDGEEEEEIDFD